MTIIRKLLGKLLARTTDKNTPPPAGKRTVDLQTDPDSPREFGFKMNWFAIRTTDVDAVLTALQMGEGREANWSSGIEAAYSFRAIGFDKDLAFVTPAVNGWVMVLGATLPYPVMHTDDRHGGIGAAFDQLFARLSASFSEVQFFGSDRRVGFIAWARHRRGEADRIFAFGDGDVYANVGSQTADETELGLPDVNGLTPEQASEKLFDGEQPLPDEDVPLQLAQRWSINPGLLEEMSLPPSCGRVVELHTGD